MKREFLKELGLEDAVIDKIMSENGKDINKSNEKIKTLEAEVSNKNELLNNANTEIASYKEMDIDAIKKSAEDYKTKFENAEKTHKAEIENLKFENKLGEYVNSLNLKNDIYKKAVIDEIKSKELKFDGDVLLGGEDFVKGFKEKYADAFADNTEKPIFADTTQGKNNRSDSSINDLRKAMGLSIKE